MYSLQGVETAAIGTVMSLSTICINICLNYCFIYGNFGAPELGIVGAAVATLVSRIVELIIILVYVLFIDKKLKMRLGELLGFDFTYLRDYVRVAAPIALSGLLWGRGAGGADRRSGPYQRLCHCGKLHRRHRVPDLRRRRHGERKCRLRHDGKTIGQGRLDMVRSYSKTMQGIFVLIGVLFGSLMFVFKDWIVGLYTVSDETKALAVSFISILSLTTMGSCYEYPVEGGIIAGGGDTKYAALMDNLFMWLFTIPAAVLSASSSASRRRHLLLSQSRPAAQVHPQRHRLQPLPLGPDPDARGVRKVSRCRSDPCFIADFLAWSNIETRLFDNYRHRKVRRNSIRITADFLVEWRDLNPRPLGPEPSTLPNCATPPIFPRLSQDARSL